MPSGQAARRAQVTDGLSNPVGDQEFVVPVGGPPLDRQAGVTLGLPDDLEMGFAVRARQDDVLDICDVALCEADIPPGPRPLARRLRPGLKERRT